jgi:hypothetical protein
MTLEITKMLVLSTSHITAETAQLLEDRERAAIDTTSDRLPVFYSKSEYGWFVYVSEDAEDQGYPSDMVEVLRYARSNDCGWLMFDCDADVIEDLPAYEWRAER